MKDWHEQGGSAFPIHGVEIGSNPVEYGMSLRDYFAAHALAAIIAKSPYKSGTLADMRASGDIEARTTGAYEYADSMLAERNK